jgi:hypothetical protein
MISLDLGFQMKLGVELYPYLPPRSCFAAVGAGVNPDTLTIRERYILAHYSYLRTYTHCVYMRVVVVPKLLMYLFFFS